MGYHVGDVPVTWPALLNNRLLIDDWAGSGRYPKEVVLLEVSPSGKYLKFRWTSGDESWSLATEVKFLDLLPSKGL